MATKTLTVTEEAYNRLASRKGEKDSFSDVILKEYPPSSLRSIAGILSHKETEELRGYVKETRNSLKKRMERIHKRMK
tara:strand:+ start:243 stop:476 length:234 start_codon:yes stop_codon:yes gene_type:complete